MQDRGGGHGYITLHLTFDGEGGIERNNGIARGWVG